MTLPAPSGSFTFLTDESGNFLTDDAGQFYLIVDAGLTAPSTRDLVNYIFRFDDLGAAERDSITGTYFGDTQLALEVLVFADVTVNSTVSNPGYWFMVTQTGLNSSLLNHPNIELVIDGTLLNAGLTSVILANIPTDHVNIVINIIGCFIINGVS